LAAGSHDAAADDGFAGHAGTVALVGRPNAGKSTLLNALMDDKVAIVSAKPQTTRNRIIGILTEARGQVVFFDLPGVHRPMHKMNSRMMTEVQSALEEVDLVLHLVDASQPWGGGEQFLFNLLEDVKPPVLGLLTKIDLVRPKQALLPMIEAYHAKRPGATVLPISAPERDGLNALCDEIFGLLPKGPPHYPADVTTTQSERFFIAELVREKLLHRTRNELPYTTGVVVDHLDESETLLRIDAVIYVERKSQKGIVIGKGGSMIKAVGQDARIELERLLGIKIYLELHVKVHARWRDDVRVLREMDPGAAIIDEGLWEVPAEEPEK
jgi:GTP-binding protein Era